MVTIKEISEFPLTQIVFVGIILYILSLAIRTLKAWLRLWEIRAIAKENELYKKEPDLKKVVELRLGDSQITKQIEKSLGFDNEKPADKKPVEKSN